MERRVKRLISASSGESATLERSFCSSFGWTSSWTPFSPYPKLRINSASAWIFSGSGVSWTRYKNGISCQKYSDATVSFASSIKSSIIFVAVFASYGLISTGFPFLSRIIFASGKSKSIEPRAWRFLRSSSDSSLIFSNIGTNS